MAPYQVLPLRARMDMGAIVIKRYSAFPKLQHYWSLTIRLFSVLSRTLVAGVLLLCKDAVDIFCSPYRLGYSLGESNPFGKMQSMYSTAQTDWVSRWESINPLQRCSRCILQPLQTGSLVGRVLPLWKDAVSVCYSPSWMGYSLGESYSFAKMRSIYSTAPTDWVTRW